MDTHSRYLTHVQYAWLATFGSLVEDLINRGHALTDARPLGTENSYRNTYTDLPDESFSCNTLTHLLRMSEKKGIYLAVFRLPVNKFDEISRVHGNRTRDAFLRCLAERLTASDAKILATGHFGLGQFGAVIPLSSVQDCFDVITPIVNKVSFPVELEEVTIHPEIDVGLCLYPTPKNCWTGRSRP